MIIAIRTVFVIFIKITGVLPEALLAFFTSKCQLCILLQRMVLGFAVAVSAVEPFLACEKFRVSKPVDLQTAQWGMFRTARRANSDLGVEDVFTGILQ